MPKDVAVAGQRSSGRRRAEKGSFRRALEPKASSGRRYSRRHADERHADEGKNILPRPSSTNVPRKNRIMAARLRLLAFSAFVLILFAVVTTRQRRRMRRRELALKMQDNVLEPETRTQNVAGEGNSSEPTLASKKATNATGDPASPGDNSDTSDNAGEKDEHPSQEHEEDKAATAVAQKGEGILPIQIEVFTRSDLVTGTRPICRISNACILANGIVSLPLWMTKADRIIRGCGVGPHIFHSGENGPKSSLVKSVDADLAQLIKLVRFKEPSTAMAEFFADTVLHGGFLFDAFDGKEKKAIRGQSSHCVTTQNGTLCDEDANRAGALALSAAAGLKPALFIPKKIAGTPGSWESKSLTLMESKYSSASLQPISVADVVNPAEKDKTSNVSATCFRSVIFSDTKFKDLPTGAFEADSAFFTKSNIDRSMRSSTAGSSNQQDCKITVGILKKAGPRALLPMVALKDKLSAIASAALPGATVSVLELDHTRHVKFSDQVAHMQDVDVLVGGSSSSLSNMAFMRAGSTVFEVYPFAWQPSSFQDMARVLGMKHKAVFAAPQTTEFKGCIEHEVYQLRKQNRIEGEANPDWVKSVEDKWEGAASEFVLTGKPGMLLNVDGSGGVSNFHTRHCARHQTLDFNVDDLAKAILLEARNICHPQT